MSDTEAELARLREDGVSPDRLIEASYFFSHFFSTPEQRRAFRDALQAAGFNDIGSDEEATGDGYWHHWSHTIRPADPEVLREADQRAAEIAAEHGVRYDNWRVARDHSTGALRDAAQQDESRA